ncbi:hypothetical protein AMECASPLE_037478 [Ameca splendens]|uniref:Uncharacterized protein n=1 Tax=Ameca splendens TaxID=208324 RepID=A0ABV0Y7T7_9TELE
MKQSSSFSCLVFDEPPNRELAFIKFVLPVLLMYSREKKGNMFVPPDCGHKATLPTLPRIQPYEITICLVSVFSLYLLSLMLCMEPPPSLLLTPPQLVGSSRWLE